MEEFSYFIADIFGNMRFVNKLQFENFFSVFESTYPDYVCISHEDILNPRFSHKNYYHDGKLYCEVLRDHSFGGSFCE